MRFSAVAALCAAPLALAGSLKARQTPTVEVNGQPVSGSATIQGAADGNNNIQIQGVNDGSVTEVIVLWFNNGGSAATQTVNAQSTVAGASGSSKTHPVTVGGAGGLAYSPNTVEAAIGDVVLFTFMSQNHTVSQSAFTTPCDLLAGGIDSGFMPNPNNTVSPPPQMMVQVTVATPQWFFCRQNGHCGKGMTFSINPSVNKTQAMFEQMAIAQNGTGTPSVITGGTGTANAGTPPPAGSVVAPPASVGSSASIVNGQGTLQNGECQCSCLCGQAAFPNAAVQGVGGFGGVGGAMPMAALMT